MTFSIVACDLQSASGPEWGVAVASKFLAVGAAVPSARAGVGAVATQALANLAYGPQGLERLGAGEDAQSVVGALTEADDERDHRQLGIVDAAGTAATYTGVQCFDWAGGVRGTGFCCQGNILVGPEVVDEMRAGFENRSGELAVRLLAALRAGDTVGGDRRGRQSAALLVVREGGGYGGGSDRAVDLRVDDNADPTTELERLFDLHRLYFPRPEDLEFIPVDESLAAELRAALAKLDFSSGTGPGYDDDLRSALFAYTGVENLEERWSDDPVIEKRVLEHLRAR
jgi:uncharacterized Ntn-hydrolase superfamily protein